MKSYSKDSRFDWHPKIPTEMFDMNFKSIMKELDQGRSKRGQNSEQLSKTRIKEWNTIAQLMIALYQVYWVFPIGSGKVSVPMTAGHYSGSSSKQGHVPNYSFRNVTKVMKVLEDRKWIRREQGNKIRGVTRICAFGDLIKIFNMIGLRWFPQIPIPEKDLIVLRNYRNPEGKTKKEKGSKINVELPESDVLDRYSSSLYQYNQFLTKHCIAFDLDDDQLDQLGQVMEKGSLGSENEWSEQKESYLDLSRLQLRRIFARGSMEKGGRFYGGWWQSIPSIYRPHITIDGLKTCEIDYSSMSLRIIYAEQGVVIPVMDDLYDIGLPDWQGTNDPRRKPIKTFINAILNDESGRYSLSNKNQKIVGISHNELKQKVHARHKGIAYLFNSGIGLHTQFIDSQIAELVMHEMMGDGILVLPIHDSFVVRAGYEQWMSVVMEGAFHQITKGLAGVEADGPRLKKHFGISKGVFNEKFEKLKEDPCYGVVNLSDLSVDELSRSDKSMMSKYVGSWEKWKRDQV